MKSAGMTKRQLAALVFVGLLSPLVRLVPSAAVNLGGKAAWLSPVLAAVPCAAYCAFLAAVARSRREGEGMADLFFRALGKRAGGAVLVVFSLWLAVYSGFMLRAAAERMLSSVYDSGNTIIFIVIMTAAVFHAACGRVRSLGATAEVFAPLLCAILLLCFVFSIEGIRAQNVLPVVPSDIAPIALGAAPVADVFATAGYFTFLLGSVKKQGGAFKTYAVMGACLLGVTLLMLLITVGTLSAPLVTRMQNAFFIVVRTVTVFGAVERIEAVVIALWVVTDFIYICVLVKSASRSFVSVVPRAGEKASAAGVCAAAAAVAFFVSPDAFDFKVLSEKIIPFASAFFTVIVLPGVFLIGKARKKL